MIKISREHVVGVLSYRNQPVAWADSGDSVEFFTRDCYDDAIISQDDVEVQGTLANPATGPLFVRGANPGDLLKVEILEIETAPTGIMRSSLTHGALVGKIDKRELKFFNISGDTFSFDKHLMLKKKPMIGVIGTAPADNLEIPTDTPSEHGGNMDCSLIQAGSTLYLPVNVQGALLALGDLHALMGDGEVLICGLECRGRVLTRVTVIKGQNLPTPFLNFQGEIMTIQSAETLDEAALMATHKMHDFIMDATKQDDNKSGMLMSLLANLAICQIVDPLKTVRMTFPLKVLEQYGFKLP